MTETIEMTSLRQSPLAAVHQALGATFSERDGWSVSATYGDLLLEYAAVRESGAGLIDLSPRGRILVSGSEAVQFLNGLITNDMKPLEVNSWMAAAFPNVQGRLIASVRVIRLPDEGTDQITSAEVSHRRNREDARPTFLIDTEAATHASVLKTIERFTLAGDFRVRDITGQSVQLTVQGRKAAGIVRAVLGDSANGLEKNTACQLPSAYGDLTVVRATHTGEDGFDLIVNSIEAAGLWTGLQNGGARPVGYEALEILRIEAGQPRYDVDMDETNVVTEALEESVSYTKGCYIGQEIIARIKYRGHVAKKLSGVRFKHAAKVDVGAVIKSSDDKEIGRVTSATYSPHLGRTIALGYLKYDYLAPDTRVAIVTGDKELLGEVTELPFVKGRWFEE